jgi:uncharacterized UBP type Zn finger protein
MWGVQKKYSDTLSFCKSLRDFSGDPLRLTEQKDVNEFCGLLFDTLENVDPRVKGLLKSMFEGTLVYQIISRECAHRSERTEPFTMLTAEVKNKSTLEDSLELYVAGETLSGDNKYQCGQCENKVEALRRCAIQNLPHVLIIHLKRFEFNMDTMSKYKVNDRCSFPMILDMEPFTVEGLALRESRQQNSQSISFAPVKRRDSSTPVMDGHDRESSVRESMDLSLYSSSRGADAPLVDPNHYRYELRGVVAHVGTSDSGHYYSFIKSREPGPDGKPVWFEYNDQHVSPFNEDDIPRECFGGIETVTTYKVRTACALPH